MGSRDTRQRPSKNHQMDAVQLLGMKKPKEGKEAAAPYTPSIHRGRGRLSAGLFEFKSGGSKVIISR